MLYTFGFYVDHEGKYHWDHSVSGFNDQGFPEPATEAARKFQWAMNTKQSIVNIDRGLKWGVVTIVSAAFAGLTAPILDSLVFFIGGEFGVQLFNIVMLSIFVGEEIKLLTQGKVFEAVIGFVGLIVTVGVDKAFSKIINLRQTLFTNIEAFKFQMVSIIGRNPILGPVFRMMQFGTFSIRNAIITLTEEGVLLLRSAGAEVIPSGGGDSDYTLFYDAASTTSSTDTIYYDAVQSSVSDVMF